MEPRVRQLNSPAYDNRAFSQSFLPEGFLILILAPHFQRLLPEDRLVLCELQVAENQTTDLLLQRQ